MIKTLTEDNKTAIRTWVEALRSGGYEQARGALRRAQARYEQDGDQEEPLQYCYCCLGVMCEILGEGEWLSPIGGMYKQAGETRSAYPPFSVYKKTGLTEAELGDFAAMNDQGKGFEVIANEIERLYLQEPVVS